MLSRTCAPSAPRTSRASRFASTAVASIAAHAMTTHRICWSIVATCARE